MSEEGPVLSSDRMAWKVMPVPCVPGEWSTLFHSRISRWLASSNLPSTIGVPGPALQSFHKGAMAFWAGAAVRSVGDGLVLAEPKVIRPLELTNSWLLPVNGAP